MLKVEIELICISVYMLGGEMENMDKTKNIDDNEKNQTDTTLIKISAKTSPSIKSTNSRKTGKRVRATKPTEPKCITDNFVKPAAKPVRASKSNTSNSSIKSNVDVQPTLMDSLLKRKLPSDEISHKIRKNQAAIDQIISLIKSIQPDQITKEMRDDLIKIHVLARDMHIRWAHFRAAQEKRKVELMLKELSKYGYSPSLELSGRTASSRSQPGRPSPSLKNMKKVTLASVSAEIPAPKQGHEAMEKSSSQPKLSFSHRGAIHHWAAMTKSKGRTFVNGKRSKPRSQGPPQQDLAKTKMNKSKSGSYRDRPVSKKSMNKGGTQQLVSVKSKSDSGRSARNDQSKSFESQDGSGSIHNSEMGSGSKVGGGGFKINGSQKSKSIKRLNDDKQYRNSVLIKMIQMTQTKVRDPWNRNTAKIKNRSKSSVAEDEKSNGDSGEQRQGQSQENEAFLRQTIGSFLIMVTTVVFIHPNLYQNSNLVCAKDYGSSGHDSRAATLSAFKSSHSSSFSASSSSSSLSATSLVPAEDPASALLLDDQNDANNNQQNQQDLIPPDSLSTNQHFSTIATKKPHLHLKHQPRSLENSPFSYTIMTGNNIFEDGEDDPHFEAMISVEPGDPCYNFTIGNEKYQEFFSPNYPNKYPNSTECEKVIRAEHGYQIGIEFRDQFSLEDSPNCAYDYLEVRDGPYGYSTPLAKLCGSDFPRDIISNDRYMFLRFVSDDSIEYQGFRAVYSFIKMQVVRPEPPFECRFNKTGVSGTIENRDIPIELTNYSITQDVPIDCMWNITVAQGYKMYLNFKEYKLTCPNNCEANYIDIYGEKLSDLARKQRFCGTQAEPVRSDDNHMNIRFFAKPDALSNVQFEITFTAFRELSNKETCRPDEFDCEDSTCIDIRLKCDGVDNCKYRYDEDKQTTCAPGNKGVLNLNSQHMVVILIVFCALVFGMCASIAISCWSKIQERAQRKREYKLRRSREASMEVGLDRTMTITSLDRSCPMGASSTTGAVGSVGEHGERASSSSGSRCRKIVTANAVRTKPGDIVDGVDDMDVGVIGPSTALGYYDSEDNGCYVPDMDMGPLHHPNPGARSLIYPSSNERRPPKQMVQAQPNGATVCTGGHHLDHSDKYSPDTPTPPQMMMVGSPGSRHLGAQSPLVGVGGGDYLYQQQPQQQPPPLLSSSQPQQNQMERDSIRSSSDCSIPPPPPPPSLSHLRNRLQLQQQQSQPQQYRTLPLDPSKLTSDSSMLIIGDNHQTVQYRHSQHTPRISSGGTATTPTMMMHPQHHPDCAQHQLNKMQPHMPPGNDPLLASSTLPRRPGAYYTGGGRPTGLTSGGGGCSNPNSNRPSPMPMMGGGGGGNSSGDTQEMLNEMDLDGCCTMVDDNDESGVGPSEQRSAMELNDDDNLLDVDDEMLTDNDLYPPSSNDPNTAMMMINNNNNNSSSSASRQHHHQQQQNNYHLLRGQSTLEEEDDSSVPLNSTNSNTGYGSSGGVNAAGAINPSSTATITARQVYYRSEAVIDLATGSDCNNPRPGVALIR